MNQNQPDPDFDKRLDDALKNQEIKKTGDRTQGSGIRGEDLSQAFRVIIELTLSIAICAFAGYWLDKSFSTLPIFLLLGVILGLIVGFMTVYKLTNNMGYSIGYAPLHKQQKDAEKSDDTNRG